MRKYLFLLFLSFYFAFSSGQIVINELDSDTPSLDDKEFIELKSDAPFQSLDGYIVVLFNGSASGNDSSYLTIDLTGYTTNINGTILIGSTNVSPVPEIIIPINIIQNGADAVGVYQAHPDDFPEGTRATTTNLIDALVYGTNDPDDVELMNLLGVDEQIDEDLNNNKDHDSIQRNEDGTYFVGSPTPGLLNDGSGIVLNGVSYSVPFSEYHEGEQIPITFTIDESISTDLNIDFNVNYGRFNEADFTGNTFVIIPAGQTSATTTLYIVEDGETEGDEIMRIKLGSLPDEFVAMNDYMQIRIIDLDFTVADFGTPLNPTYNVVQSTQPAGYYSSLNGLSGDNLNQALQDIIADPDVVRAQTYADVIDILKEADQNPANSSEVWLVYTEQGRPKLDFQTTSNNLGTWNREHVWPRSRGGFDSIEEDEIADGPDFYWTSTADSIRHGNSDAHALRAVDSRENSSRGNRDFGEYNGPSGNLGSFKGDVARSVFYMAVRYNGLEVVPGNPANNTVGILGDLNVLLDWHRNDPPDDFEMNRNNIVYTWQYNRNPFIDQPDLVEYIWGNRMGDTWEQLSVNDHIISDIEIHPNPTTGKIHFKGLKQKTDIEIFSMVGERVLKTTIENNHSLNLNLTSGIYMVVIQTDGQKVSKKLIVH